MAYVISKTPSKSNILQNLTLSKNSSKLQENYCSKVIKNFFKIWDVERLYYKTGEAPKGRTQLKKSSKVPLGVASPSKSSYHPVTLLCM